MNQVEFLLRLSENARDQGDEINRRHHEERERHGKELQDLWRMIELARQNVWAELHRFGQMNEPKATAQIPQQGQIPRAVQTAKGNPVSSGVTHDERTK